MLRRGSKERIPHFSLPHRALKEFRFGSKRLGVRRTIESIEEISEEITESPAAGGIGGDLSKAGSA
jgi:hypothetical protein